MRKLSMMMAAVFLFASAPALAQTQEQGSTSGGAGGSAMSSGGDGMSAASATLRAVSAERWSPERSQASATNDEPAAIPPNQK